jgi:hypothetical protein
MEKTLDERLAPTHLLPETDEALKKEVEKVVAPPQPDEPDLEDPKNEKEYTFLLEHTDPRGKIWKGKFTTKILSLHERAQVGIMRSRIVGGADLQSLDGLTVEIALMRAHLAYSLTDRPKWAENLAELDDPGVLQAIFSEVGSHESHFLGWDKSAG